MGRGTEGALGRSAGHMGCGVWRGGHMGGHLTRSQWRRFCGAGRLLSAQAPAAVQSRTCHWGERQSACKGGAVRAQLQKSVPCFTRAILSLGFIVTNKASFLQGLFASNLAKVLHYRQINFLMSKIKYFFNNFLLVNNNKKISAAAARLANIQISMIGVALQVGQVRELERKET